jgi:hypothetical protein
VVSACTFFNPSKHFQIVIPQPASVLAYTKINRYLLCVSQSTYLFPAHPLGQLDQHALIEDNILPQHLGSIAPKRNHIHIPLIASQVIEVNSRRYTIADNEILDLRSDSHDFGGAVRCGDSAVFDWDRLLAFL